jgi:c-di-AMP phosphodiesterase-like protein
MNDKVSATNERRLTIARAMAEAIAQEMRVDERVFVMGEDIGTLGGVFGNTRATRPFPKRGSSARRWARHPTACGRWSS